MLEVRHLTAGYRDRAAVCDVSFVLPPGQAAGILGPNGAGKSTLAKAMLGLVPCQTGGVTFAERPLWQQRRRVAYLPQRSCIDWDYPATVWQVALMGCIPRTGWRRRLNSGSQAAVRAALERVGMWSHRKCAIGALSGGQQQRAFLARVLAQQADLLLLDEPFAGVDSTTEAILFEIFRELKACGKTLVTIGHDVKRLSEQCECLLLLNQRLVAAGRPPQVLTAENLARTYTQQQQPVAS